MNSNFDKAFTDLVQMHERAWGDEHYLGRPSLSDLLQKRIVAMWVSEDKTAKNRYMFSTHENPGELNTLVHNLITIGKVSTVNHRKLSRIFINQQPVKFEVRLAIEKPK